MNNDRIADMLTRIRNASLAKHLVVVVPYTKLTEVITKILVEEGFIKSYVRESVYYDGSKVNKNKSSLFLSLIYDEEGKPFISELKRISTPGCRTYSTSKRLPTIRDGYGTAIISTSRGIMTNEKAREEGIGGEILFTIW
jgi:small subunit ribosomal protein S8